MTRTRGNPGRPRAPRNSISIASAVDSALRLIDTEGLHALSIRRLAQELGVGTMTLYNYFSDKDELLDQIALRVLGDIREHTPAAGAWEERLSRMMGHLRAAMRNHPGVAALSLTRRGPLPALDPFREAILSILHEAGFPVRMAVNALTTLVTYVTGYTMVEHARSGVQVDRERERLAALPRQEFPRLKAAARYYASHVSRDAFEVGLRSLLDGLSTELAELPVRVAYENRRKSAAFSGRNR